MANSLLPDLSAEQSKKKSKAAGIILEFDYDNTNNEVDGAMKTFQYKFSSKRWILSITAYSLLLISAVVMVILNPAMYFVYAAILICVGGLILSSTAKLRMRKKVIRALDSMDPETYHCRLYDDKIEIETIIKPRDNSGDNNAVESGTEIEEENKPVRSVYVFNTGYLDFAENHDSYLLVVARRQFHCFPKRCLTEEQCDVFKNTLFEKTSGF